MIRLLASLALVACTAPLGAAGVVLDLHPWVIV
jgi:hypothetical protein